MMLVYYLPALYRRVICFIDPLEMIKDTVQRRTRLLWPGEEEEEDVTPQLILATHYQMQTDTTQTHQVSSEDLTYTNLREAGATPRSWSLCLRTSLMFDYC